MAAPTAPAPARRRLRAWVPTAAVLLVDLTLAFLLFASVWAHPTTVLAGDQLDSGPHTWFLAWTPFALSHGHNPLFADGMGAPEGVNLAWNIAEPLLGILVWPVAAIAGPVVAFNLALTLGPALAAFAASLVLRRWVEHPVAAALGGLLFGFSPYMAAHAASGHTNLVTVAGIPLVLLILDSLVVGQARSPRVLGVLLGALTAAQVYVSEEVLAGEVTVSVLGLAALGVVAGAALRTVMVRRVLRRILQALATAVPVFLVLAAPLLWMQFLGPRHITGAVQPHGRYVTDLLNLVVPTRVEAIAPARAAAASSAWTGNIGEWNGYLSLPLLAAAVAVTVWQWRRAVVRWAALTAAAVLVLSLGPSLHVAGHDTRIPLPWRIVDHLPVFNSALPARLMVFTFLLCGLLVAVGVDALIRERNRLRIAGAALLALTTAVLAPALMPTRPNAVPAFFTSDAIPQGTTAYVLPSVQPPVMLWQVESNWRFRMVGGWYLGPDEHNHVHTGPLDTPLSRAVADVETSGDVIATDFATYRKELNADGVHSIIVTAYEPNQRAVVQFFRLLTQTPPRSDGAGTYYFLI